MINAALRTKISRISMLVASLLLAPLVGSASISYNVNLGVGTGGVHGFILTDGDTGALNAGDVLDWDLFLNDTAGTFELLGPLSGSNSQAEIVNGPSNLSATPTELLFNFGAGSGDLLFQSPTAGSGGPALCFESDTLCSSEPAGIQLFATSKGNEQVTPLSVNTVIGTAAPEPSTLALLGAAAIALSIRKRRIS